MTHRALLALGSNLGDRWGFLRDAVACLPDVVAVSNVYETPPVGGPDQGPYLNCVVRLETLLSARALLEEARRRENEAGRERIEHWGPRTLDVDVLWVTARRSMNLTSRCPTHGCSSELLYWCRCLTWLPTWCPTLPRASPTVMARSSRAGPLLGT